MKRALIVPTALGLLWTMLLVALFVWSIMGERRHISELAKNQAKAMAQQIVSTRSWNSMSGGVFVHRSENIEPNSYLPLGERVMRSEDGRELVKVNPAFMTRLISEIAEVRNDVRFHLTSLSPVRPENSADVWERESLEMLSPGQDRFELVPVSDGSGKFRYMSPLICETSCLQCHLQDSVGSIRGGITVSIPAGPLLSYQSENMRKQAVAYGIIWIIGLLGLGGTSYELNRRKELAEASCQIKSRFLANMSHDMRTPLTGILGLTERMFKHGELKPQDSRYAKLISQSASNLLEIVNDILDCSRIDSGRLDLVARPFDPREAVAKTTSVFSFAAKEKGLEFVCRIDQAVPAALCGDEFRYRQVLANLLGNAVKFTERGQVSLDVRLEPGEQGCFVLRTAVSDSGVGIAGQDQDSIFECFSQVDDSLSRRHAGSGLGLSIARQLARMMGGDVTVSSSPGLGSEFVFTARFAPAGPACACAPRPEADFVEPQAGLLRGVKVLVADDHEVNRILLFDILTEEAALPFMAASGEEALDLCRTSRCGLILMDLQMPGMGGLEAIKLIRELERERGWDKTPIIVLTAFAFPAEALELPQAEIAAVLEKPLNVAKLKQAMIAAAGNRMPSAQDSRKSQEELGEAREILDVDQALRLLSGRKDYYSMLANEFLGCSPGLGAEFAGAVKRDDRREAARIAHILKTSSASLGALKLSGLAADLERLAKAGESLSQAHCGALSEAIERTLGALRKTVAA